MPSTVNNFNIRDVWKNNMEEEFAKIRDVVENYPYVAMVRVKYFVLTFVGVNCFKSESFRWLTSSNSTKAFELSIGEQKVTIRYVWKQNHIRCVCVFFCIERNPSLLGLHVCLDYGKNNFFDIHDILKLEIISFILITCLFDARVTLYGETRSKLPLLLISWLIEESLHC